MLEFLYNTGWGALTLMLLFQIPFLTVFFFIIHRKSVVDNSPNDISHKKLSRTEGIWIAVVVFLFIAVNAFAIPYMPFVNGGNTVMAGDAKEVDITARSWSYDISERTIEAGQPVRFLARSMDTMHSFTVYDPDGNIEVNLQLMPGLERATTTVHTFTEPGTYKVRCLEYCGIAHHRMQDEITVVPKESQAL